MLLACKGDLTMQRAPHKSQVAANKTLAEAVLITLATRLGYGRLRWVGRRCCGRT